MDYLEQRAEAAGLANEIGYVPVGDFHKFVNAMTQVEFARAISSFMSEYMMVLPE